MTLREEQLDNLESPFIDALISHDAEASWEGELARLEAESPFRQAFDEEPKASEEWDSEEFYNERIPDEFFGEEEERELDREGIEERQPAEIPAAIAEFAVRLGRERAAHSRRAPADEESALLQDYRDTLTGGRARWGKRYGKAPFTVEAIGRAWTISREQETRFKYSSSPVRRLQGFAPPSERVALTAHPLVGSSDKAPVAPIVGRFAEELKRRYPGMRAENYRGHGGGSFAGRGYSLDLYIKSKDDRGFFRPDDALAFLRAVHDAANAVNAQWRVIYNDFSVADAMNRATGQRNVIFVGTVFRDRGRRINGINWHGPDPLILHFHLDLAPRAGTQPSSGPLRPPAPLPLPTPPAPAKPTAELVRFTQRVLNVAEGERLAVDGDLGPRTRAALERFRKRHNLGAGGLLDAKIELALAQRALEELAQQSLFQIGVRDTKTEQALRNFRAARGLLPVATLDAASRAALADAIARRRGGQQETDEEEYAMSFESPVEEAFDVEQEQEATGGRPTLRQGARGEGVRELQLRLQTVANRAVRVDGIFGPDTRDAVIRFQERHRLNPDGVVGRRTWDALLPVSSGPALHAPALQRITDANKQASERARARDHAGALQIGRAAYADPALALKPEMRGTVVFNMGTDHHSLREFDQAIQCYVEAICAPGGSEDRVPLGLERIREARLRLSPTPASELRRRWTENVAAAGAPQRAGEAEEVLHLELFSDENHEASRAELGEEEDLDAEPLEEAQTEPDDEEQFDIDEEADEAEDVPAAGELDPALLDIAERTMVREVPEFEELASKRWTTCFSTDDVTRVKTVYQDNDAAAQANSGDRCSCIVMLNVALGQLLSLPVKSHPARSGSSRTVDMAKLTTESIDKAMRTLVKSGYATGPTLMNFYDRRKRTAGTLKPVNLKQSVQAKVLSLASTEGCWFAFGLSIMDGYHSVLLLVDRASTPAKIFWLDQFSADVTDDVTSRLDQRITDKTQTWWQAVMDSKGKGYNTTIRLWRLRKRRKT